MRANPELAPLAAQINRATGVPLNREQRRIMAKAARRAPCKQPVRRNLIDPVQYAIDGARVTSEAILNELDMRDLSSLDAIMHGRGGLQEWCDMDASVTMCMSASSIGIGPEALEVCRTAKRELEIAKARHIKTGILGLSGIGIQALRHVMEYAYLQRRSIGRSKFEEVMRVAIKKQKELAA